MDDLVTWLRAQLDDAERVANACADAFAGVADERLDLSKLHPDVRAHIYRWTPAHVDDDLAAKRRMLDSCDRMTIVDGYGGLMARDARMFRRLLALPYADRAGYREEWRP